MSWYNVDPHTEDLLDAIDTDDMINYLYDKKKISHQVVKKYFGIKDIDERPNMSYWTRLDLETLGISEDDVLQDMSEDEICQYLKDCNYKFPNDCVFDKDVDPFFLEDDDSPENCENNVLVDYIEHLIQLRYGKQYTYQELKDKICELIDSYGYNHR